MTRKSAASAKVKPMPILPERPNLEEHFKIAKEGFIVTVETALETSKRVDNLMNLRDMSRRFWKDDATHNDVKYFKMLQHISTNAYEDILNAVKEFDLEEFKKEEMKDYFEDIIPKVEDINTEQELLQAAIIFMTVQPFGNKMVEVHRLVQEDLEKIKAIEEMEEK